MKILDACCGSRMFYYQKTNPNVTYMDIREEKFEIHGKKVNVAPNVKADFRDMPFYDNTFDLVVFDPPHLKWAGPNGIMKAQYGQLDIKTWEHDIYLGFYECMRVLKSPGTLIFKWSDVQIHVKEVLELIKELGFEPLLGDKRGQTRWLVFVKE